MFGGPTNPFGGQSSSPFGSSSTTGAFGTSTSANPFGQATNPFAPKPFGGGTTPFGGMTQSSLFGGTATGMFGATTQQPAFGATAPAFGTSSPSFGGTAASPFGGTTTFGQQKPATTFGGFGANAGQANPFGAPAFGQAQPAQPAAFGGSTLAFGASTPAFGTTTTPAFGASAPAFGAAASAAPAFGATAAPSFGATTTAAFGQTASTPAFGSTPFGAAGAFGQQQQQQQQQQQRGSRVAQYQPTNDPESPANQLGRFLSISAMPAYKNKSVEELRWEDYQQNDKGGPAQGAQAARPAGSIFGSSPQANAFGTVATANPNPFGGVSPSPNPFATATPAFGAAASTLAFGATTTPAFGSSASLFGSPAPAFGAATASPTPAFGAQPTSAFGSTGASSPAFGATSVFGSTTGSAFGSSLFGATATTGAFGASTAGAFGASTTPSPFGAGSTPAFGGAGLFGSAPSTFGGTTTTSAFGAPSTSAFGSTTPAFGSTAASSSAFGGSSIFGNTGSGFGFGQTQPVGLTTSTPATTPSLFGNYMSTPATNSTGFGFNLGSQQGTSTSLFGNCAMPSFQQPSQQQQQQQQQMQQQMQQQQQQQAAASQFGALHAPVASPFGYMPALPQMTVGRSLGTTSKVQYGIGSTPVSEKPAQVRMTSLLTPRHITPRSRVRMQARRYHPNSGSPRVSFFSDGEEIPSTPKADVLFVPRENPRALFIRQPDSSPSLGTPTRTSAAAAAVNGRSVATPVENGRVSYPSVDVGDDVEVMEERMHRPLSDAEPSRMTTARGNDDEGGQDKRPRQYPVRIGERANDRMSPLPRFGSERMDARHENGHASFSGHHTDGNGESLPPHGADIEAHLPKLRHPEYYTEPKIQELAAKERACPGYTTRVKDFVVGRRGFGSVRFLGETDVRQLDLEGIVQFNKCEVLVYMDESQKPAVGQGLNKAAEVTLLNVRSIDKRSGQVLGGPEMERFERKLKKKTEEQGAEFVKYDASKGEWVFRVQHFSRYGFEDSDEDDEHLDRVRKGKAMVIDADLMDGGEDGDIADICGSGGMDIVAEDTENCDGGVISEEVVGAEGISTLHPQSTLAHSLPSQLRLDPVRMQQMKHLLFPLDEEETEGRKRGPFDSAKSRHVKVSTPSGDASRPVRGSPADGAQRFSSQRRGSHSSWVNASPARRPTDVPLMDVGVPASPSVSMWLVPSEPQSTDRQIGHSKASKRPRVQSSGFSLESPVLGTTFRACEGANAGLFLGKSFRVGWGPNGVLVHAGNPAGKSGVGNAVSSTICVEKVAWDRTVRDGSRVRRDDLMELQFIEPLVWHKSMSRRVEQSDGERGVDDLLHKLLCGRENLAYICQRYKALLGQHEAITGLSEADKVVLRHQKMVWELVDILFAEIRLPQDVSEESVAREEEEEAMDEKGARDEVTEQLQRRANLSRWIQGNVCMTIKRELELVSESDPLTCVFTHLSGRQLEEATGRAISIGDLRLASLLTQVGGLQSARADIELQLKVWGEVGTSESPFMNQSRVAIYKLLAGDLDGALGHMEKPDWKRHVGLVMWYLLQASCPLDIIIKQYRLIVETGKAKPPVPLYVEKAGEIGLQLPPNASATGSILYDIGYHLLILFSGDESAALDSRKMLRSAAWTFDRLDHRLSWHVHSVLVALGVLDDDPNLHSLHMDFAAQLMCNGLCEWAIYVVLNMRLGEKDGHLRETIVQELLCLSCEDWISSKGKQNFFKDLGVPTVWLHKAQVIYWRYRHDSEKELVHLVLSEQWQAAHKVLVSTVAPKLFLRKCHEELRDYVSRLEPHKEEIEHWAEGAGVYLEYYMLREKVLAGTLAVEQLEASKALFDLVKRAGYLWTNELHENRIVYMKMAESAVALLLKGAPPSKQAIVHDLALEAPLTEDNRVCHVQAAMLRFTSWLTEGVA